MECVEKKMRLELRLQHLQLGAGQARFQRHGMKLTIPKTPIRIEGVPDTDNAAIDQPVEVEMVHKNHAEQVGPRVAGIHTLASTSAPDRTDGHMHRGNNRPSHNMDAQVTPPIPAHRIVEPPADPEDHQRENRPGVPFHRFPPERLGPSDVHAE